MRHPISKAARRLTIYMVIAAVVIPVLIIASATAGAATSTTSFAPHHFGSRSTLLSSSIKLDPVAQMRHYGMRISLHRIRAHHRAYLKKVRAAHLRWLKHQRDRQQRLAAQTATVALASGSAPNSTLQSIAHCESGGDPTAVSPDGTYRGKYQFTYPTWASVGGSGDPAAAPEAEQDRRAAQLYATAGAGQWPWCGR